MAVTFIDNLKLNQLILIRHGEPDIDFKEKYSYEEAVEYTKEYDRVGVRNIKTNPVKIMDYENVRVLSSPLPRAHETAKTLFPDKEIVVEPLFTEFNSQVMKLPGKHSTKTWLRVSAFFWFMGYTKTGYISSKQELRRVKEALQHINSLLEKSSKIVIVSHGMFIYFLLEQLKKSGWKTEVNGGRDYLATHLLIRKK